MYKCTVYYSRFYFDNFFFDKYFFGGINFLEKEIYIRSWYMLVQDSKNIKVEPTVIYSTYIHYRRVVMKDNCSLFYT